MSEEPSNAAQILVGVIGFVAAAMLMSQLGEICSTPKDARLFGVAFCWGVPCVLSTVFGVGKNRVMFGFIVGALLGWLGVVIIGCFRRRSV